MNANLFEEERMTQLNQALRDYENAKQNYQRMVRQAVSERDPVKQKEYFAAIEAENKRLTTIVQGLVTALQEGNLENKKYSGKKLADLQKELEKYKEEVEYIRGRSDKAIQLRQLLDNLTTESTNDRKQYYGYIVGILVLLIVVFIFFVYSYAASVFAAVTETVTAPVTQVVNAVTAPITE